MSMKNLGPFRLILILFYWLTVRVYTNMHTHVLMHACTWMGGSVHKCYGKYVEVTGHLSRVDSYLLPVGSRDQIQAIRPVSSHIQTPLPTEQSHQPLDFIPTHGDFEISQYCFFKEFVFFQYLFLTYLSNIKWLHSVGFTPDPLLIPMSMLCQSCAFVVIMAL